MMGELLPMKAIAIIDVPDGEGKWYIDGEIRYTENESLMKKFDADMIPLKPLPQKKEETFAYWIARGCNDAESYINGWNACLEEITGETE